MTQRALADHVAIALDPELRDAADSAAVCDLDDLTTARHVDAELTNSKGADHLPGLDPEAVNVQDVAIARRHFGPPIALRIYRPRWGRANAVLLMAHGGAYCMGSLQTEHLRCLLYAQGTGATVVSVDYALAPEHPFPAGLTDCITAFAWVKAHLDGLGVAGARVGVAGVSAGAGLAAATALWARDHQLGDIACLMLLFPALDCRQATRSARNGSSLPGWDSVQNAKMWRIYLDPDSAPSPYASPSLAEDLRGFPPTLIHTADLDPLRDEGVQFASHLMAGDVPVDLHTFPGTFHVFDLAQPRAVVSQRALSEQTGFLAHLLRDANLR